MRTTIDAAGRILVPKVLREDLGLSPGTELDLESVDGRLQVSVPSRIRIEETPRGARLVADHAAPLTSEQVREHIDRGRR